MNIFVFTVSSFYPVDCVWGAWSAWDSCSASCGGGYQWRNRSIIQEALNGGLECENCTDSISSGNCGILALINTYDVALAESQCDRGNPSGLGAQYCEETCDDVLGQFCPNANEYQVCNTDACPGNGIN